jgi:hypothetical protein
VLGFVERIFDVEGSSFGVKRVFSPQAYKGMKTAALPTLRVEGQFGAALQT